MCRTCGLVFNGSGGFLSFDDEGYVLYAHAPTQAFERMRQAAYADWLVSMLSQARPESVFEAGAGNGSLLIELQARLPSIRATGIDPAPGAVAAARTAGLAVREAMLEDWEPERLTDVALAVNVIEHTADPTAFLERLARCGRRVCIVCPNGAGPSSELLFWDHRWSFTPSLMRSLFRRCGLDVEHQEAAPRTLGAFFATIGHSAGATSAESTGDEAVGRERSVEAVRAYLQAWSTLDQVLLERVAAAGEHGLLGCFGAGEAAGLLRAYAPRTWELVDHCIMDDPEDATFGKLPIVPLQQSRARVVVLGVRPAIQPIIADRLEGAGRHPIRWDDVIET